MLQIDPIVRYQFSAYSLSSEFTLVALMIVRSLWISLTKIHVGFLAGVHVFPCSVYKQQISVRDYNYSFGSHHCAADGPIGLEL
jgi:hypothetical protein